MFILLGWDEEEAGINRIYWLYREDGQGVRKRKRRKRAIGVRAPIRMEERPNGSRSIDFVQDQMANSRRLRIQNMVYDVTHECLAAIRTPRFLVTVLLGN